MTYIYIYICVKNKITRFHLVDTFTPYGGHISSVWLINKLCSIDILTLDGEYINLTWLTHWSHLVDIIKPSSWSSIVTSASSHSLMPCRERLYDLIIIMVPIVCFNKRYASISQDTKYFKSDLFWLMDWLKASERFYW